MKRIKKKEPDPTLSIRDFYNRRNRVLLWHEKGGLGDVYMHRMIFEDFHRVMPEVEIVFACLPEYHDAADDHPYVSEVVDARTVNPKDFTLVYNTCVTLADRYENKKAPFCDAHRSDIWANYCGVLLQNHDMHIQIDEKIARRMQDRMNALRTPGQPLVAFIPTSKMIAKTLLDWQIKTLMDELKDCSVVGLNKSELPGIPGIYNVSIREWVACIDAADYVVSVDTAAFHVAGGLKKPLVGIFTFADGKTYGKHFDFVLVQKHRDNGDWDCGPCFKFGECPKSRKTPKPCLTEISEEELRNGIRQMFKKWPFSNSVITSGK
jgi:ADP-heptose:LPS heptosyltransferase